MTETETRMQGMVNALMAQINRLTGEVVTLAGELEVLRAKEKERPESFSEKDSGHE